MEFFSVNQNNGCSLGEEAMRKRLRGLLKSGEVVRVGRNAYCVSNQTLRNYRYEYSAESSDIAKAVMKAFPGMEFNIFELVQLNEFVNHQIAHNVRFLSVEGDIINYVFNYLKERYPGRILLNPTPEMYHQYWYDGMIVLTKRVTEAPIGENEPWESRLEKILVDLMSDNLLQDIISQSELTAVFEGAFEHYAIDESCLFRYAKRRNAELRLKTLIREKTTIQLKVG